MGLISRLTTIVKAKMQRLLDRAEDPRETLDYSYEKQLELLRKVKQGVVEVVTAKRRLQYQAERLTQDLPKLDEQARQAMAAGREDLARQVLQRKQLALNQLQDLDSQVAGLEQEQERLTLAEQRLSAKVEAFRTQKEVIKAQYTAAEAQVKIGEALSGVSEEMADVGTSIERAQNKTEEMRARASAIDELAKVGVLEDLSRSGDPVAQELSQLAAQQNVEQELAALKRELGKAPQAAPLGPGRGGAGPAAPSP
ncbi:MAG: PspA/IM30 family protein [Chloroflexi bacterium]|nr:PspA/IM30 family protein [Chloroflexota bacterium]